MFVVKKLFLILVFFVGSFSVQLYGITVYDVIERVVNNAPELRIIFEKKMQSVESYKGEKSSYLPQVYAVFNREYQKDDAITSSSDSSWTNTNKLQIIMEQRIFDLEQMTSILRASQIVQTQEFENQKLLESLIQVAVVSYYDVIQSEYTYAIAKEYLRQVREIEALSVNMRTQGDATLADINIVQARLADANAQALVAQANLERVKLRLAYLLNLISKDQILQSSNVLPELTNKDFYDLSDKIIGLLPITPEALISDVLNNNIDVLILQSNLCTAGYDVEKQKSRYLPVVNLTGELRSEEERAGSNFQRYAKLTIEARYSIYDGGGRGAGIRQYSSALKELEYQYDILLRDTSDESFSTFNLLKSYEQQRLSILKEIETTEEVDRIYNLQFKFSSLNLLDRLDNLERLALARGKLVDIDYSILVARMQILMLMGRFVEFFGFQNYLEVSKLKLC